MRPRTFLKLNALFAIGAGVVVVSAALGAWVPEDIPGISYPRIARAASISGVVTVEFKIKPDGVVANATAISGPPILRTAAVEAAKKWRFKPSREDNPVFRVSFDFRLEGSCKTQCCRENLVFHYPDSVTLTSEIPGIQPSAPSPR